MKNPWTRKNPLMSMWMSGANAVVGAARGRAAAEGKRQAATLMAKGAKQMVGFWTDVLAPPRPGKKKRR